MFVHRLYDVLGPENGIKGMIILNGPPLDDDLVQRVWPSDQATPKYPVVCADGAANRLYAIKSKRVPSVIAGDLDSVTPQVLAHYRTLGVDVCEDGDQDHNDFEKALRALDQIVDSTSAKLPVLVIGGHGGRFDQTLGNLNTLYQAAEKGSAMWWIDSCNAVLALPAGANRIDIDATFEGPTVGLVPVGGPVEKVTTDGLKWNLHEQMLSYGSGGLISTSNRVMQSVVFVRTSRPLLWTIELNFKH